MLIFSTTKIRIISTLNDTSLCHDIHISETITHDKTGRYIFRFEFHEIE